MIPAQLLQIAAADPAMDPNAGRGPEWGKAAPVALLIILLLGVALFVLIRSMNAQLRKVPSEFMRSGTPAAEPPAGPGPATPKNVDGTTAAADTGPPSGGGTTPRA